jgi:hypothetical protein
MTASGSLTSSRVGDAHLKAPEALFKAKTLPPKAVV